VPLIEFPPAGGDRGFTADLSATIDSDSRHFSSETGHGRASTITDRHLLDRTNAITIGAFTTVAGFQSQFISHTINIKENQQTSRPISIGDYSFVGSNSVLLTGAALPNYCVFCAKLLLNMAYAPTHRLYGRVPARKLSSYRPIPAISTTARVSSSN